MKIGILVDLTSPVTDALELYLMVSGLHAGLGNRHCSNVKITFDIERFIRKLSLNQIICFPRGEMPCNSHRWGCDCIREQMGRNLWRCYTF